MSNMIFTKGASTFTWSGGRQWPISDPVKVNVVVDYSDGRQLYAYNKGVEEQFFNLDFVRVTDTDHSNYLNWLRNVAVGPLNTFTFTDENSTEHTVRLMDTEDTLEEVDPGQWSGRVKLRKEI